MQIITLTSWLPKFEHSRKTVLSAVSLKAAQDAKGLTAIAHSAAPWLSWQPMIWFLSSLSVVSWLISRTMLMAAPQHLGAEAARSQSLFNAETPKMSLRNKTDDAVPRQPLSSTPLPMPEPFISNHHQQENNQFSGSFVESASFPVSNLSSSEGKLHASVPVSPQFSTAPDHHSEIRHTGTLPVIAPNVEFDTVAQKWKPSWPIVEGSQTVPLKTQFSLPTEPPIRPKLRDGFSPLPPESLNPIMLDAKGAKPSPGTRRFPSSQTPKSKPRRRFSSGGQLPVDDLPLPAPPISRPQNRANLFPSPEPFDDPGYSRPPLPGHSTPLWPPPPGSYSGQSFFSSQPDEYNWLPDIPGIYDDPRDFKSFHMGGDDPYTAGTKAGMPVPLTFPTPRPMNRRNRFPSGQAMTPIAESDEGPHNTPTDYSQRPGGHGSPRGESGGAVPEPWINPAILPIPPMPKSKHGLTLVSAMPIPVPGAVDALNQQMQDNINAASRAEDKKTDAAYQDALRQGKLFKDPQPGSIKPPTYSNEFQVTDQILDRFRNELNISHDIGAYSPVENPYDVYASAMAGSDAFQHSEATDIYDALKQMKKLGVNIEGSAAEIWESVRVSMRKSPTQFDELSNLLKDLGLTFPEGVRRPSKGWRDIAIPSMRAFERFRDDRRDY